MAPAAATAHVSYHRLYSLPASIHATCKRHTLTHTMAKNLSILHGARQRAASDMPARSRQAVDSAAKIHQTEEISNLDKEGKRSRLLYMLWANGPQQHLPRVCQTAELC
jgi:hypothetical protein